MIDPICDYVLYKLLDKVFDAMLHQGKIWLKHLVKIWRQRQQRKAIREGGKKER